MGSEVPKSCESCFYEVTCTNRHIVRDSSDCHDVLNDDEDADDFFDDEEGQDAEEV